MNLTVTPYRNNINVAFASKTGHTNPQRTVSPKAPKDYIATPDAFEKETFNVDIALGQLKNIKDEKSSCGCSCKGCSSSDNCNKNSN